MRGRCCRRAVCEGDFPREFKANAERGRVVVTTPAVLEAHSVWIADSDLVVV